MTAILEAKRLRKNYGKFCAVREFTVTVEEGEILGFIGPNGAGKSTTLKMIATILRPSAGDALVCGRSITRQANEVRRLIGYMPDVCGLYEDMQVDEYLRFFAAVYGIRGAKRSEMVAQVLDITGLQDKRLGLCGALSRGMSQRLHLARVLLHDPKLLLLDEPASGLDPRARIEFRELILTLKKLGKTVIISSHILSELGEMCDSIAVIEKSELVYTGAVGEAAGKVKDEGDVFLVRVVDRQEGDDAAMPGRADLLQYLESLDYVDAVRDGEDGGVVLVRFQDGFKDHHRLNSELVARKFRVEEFVAQKVDLEDAFLHLTKGIVQ